jgi:hypothetical protein
VEDTTPTKQKTIFSERLKLVQTENLEPFTPCNCQNSSKHDKKKGVQNSVNRFKLKRNSVQSVGNLSRWKTCNKVGKWRTGKGVKQQVEF